MEQAFALFDADGSGVISREEFKAALERLGFQGDADRTDLPALTEEEIEALIDSADANGDGQWSEYAYISVYNVYHVNMYALLVYSSYIVFIPYICIHCYEMYCIYIYLTTLRL